MDIQEAATLAARGVGELRDENAQLKADKQELERANLQLKAENETLRKCLDAERAERGYYQRFAVEASTLMNLVTKTCDEVMEKANQAAMHERPAIANLPEVEIPKFLLNGAEDESRRLPAG